MKKILALLVAFTLVMAAFTACSSDNSAAADPGSDQPQSTEDAAAEDSADSEAPADSAAPADAKDIKLGLTLNTFENPWNVAVVKGFEKGCEELGIQALPVDSQYKLDKQVSILESFIADEYDGFLIGPIDQNGTKDVVDEAKEKGIVVGSVAQNQDNAHFMYTMDEKEYGLIIGRQAGEWIRDNLDGKAKVALITQDNVEAVIPRGDGVQEGLLEICPDIDIVSRQAGDTPELGMKIIESVLQQHPDLNVVVATNDSGGIGGYQAMVASNAIGDDRAVFSGDATAEALANMQADDGIYRGTVDLFPYKAGYESAHILYRYITEGIPAEQELVWLDMVPVPQEDLLSGKYQPQG